LFNLLVVDSEIVILLISDFVVCVVAKLGFWSAFLEFGGWTLDFLECLLQIAMTFLLFACVESLDSCAVTASGCCVPGV